MTSSRVDIAIVGGGLVGASLGLALTAGEQSPWSVAMIESRLPLPTAANAHPSFDARSTALSLSSRDLYARLGVWPRIAERQQEILRIHVSDRGRFGSATMDCREENLPALGHVVENPWLGRVLYDRLQADAAIRLMAPATVTDVLPLKGGHRLCLDTANGAVLLDASLVVVADGVESGCCRVLGIASEVRDYGQSALVANVVHARRHGGMAYERFGESGPMALLPLPDDEQGRPRSALIWVNDTATSRALLVAGDSDFRRRLQLDFGYRVGRFVQLGQRYSYPLRLSKAVEQLRPGLIVLGNAAHTLHPVAGQGFNLSLRDVDCLTRVLLGDAAQDCGPGDIRLLGDYVAAQSRDQWRTIMFSDWLPRLFGRGELPVAVGRDLGLVGLDLVAGWRSGFVRFATGYSGA